MRTLALAVALSIPATLWTWHTAPHWIQELQSNLVANSMHGSLSDPGPASSGSHGIGMVVSLQTVISLIKDDPAFFNPTAYEICGILFIAWIIAMVRSDSIDINWLEISAISALSILPIYHRIYDTKLLLLTIPACAMLWVRGGALAKLAVAGNIAGWILTSGVFWAVLLSIMRRFVPLSGPFGLASELVQVAPVPLFLLSSCGLYLWLCLSRVRGTPGNAATLP